MAHLRLYSVVFLLIVNFAIFSQAPNISSIPISINVDAIIETSVTDSFCIANTGDADLNCSILGYSGVLMWLFILHENDFSIFPGTDYTNSNWESVSGGAQVTGNNVTGILTSPQFSTADYDEFYLQFDQNFYYQSGSSAKVEYNNGSGWIEVYFQNTDTTTAHQRIALPQGPTGQIRFTGFTTKVTGNIAFWFIDNIEVGGSDSYYKPCSWLTINSSSECTVNPSDSTMISFTCNAAGLTPGTYNANFKINSNDPDEPAKYIPVEFKVCVVPEAPAFINVSLYDTFLQVWWSEVPDATSYDVYSSDEPYGNYSLIANVTTAYYIDSEATDPKKFFYVIVKND